MTGFESVFFWATAVFLALTFFFSVLALVFHRASAFGTASWSSIVALLTLTTLGVARWITSGHPPFVTLFESMIMAIWFLLFIFTAVRFKSPGLRIALAPLSAAALLLLGWSSSLDQSASPLSAALQNVWLFIHASFATSGAATFLTAASLATIYLMGEERHRRLRDRANGLPSHASLPSKVMNFVIFGLILWGIMIASGSIWAHSAWGRYWGWDPIEVWSLLSWLLYALVFHARLTFKVPHRVFCWLTIAAAIMVVFSLWGVQYVYRTIHTYG